jgi:RND family efflux transporter MFP subunit
MPVEFAVVKRAPVKEQILIVGNLIGAATVQVVPRVNGRLQVVHVKLGDPVRRGQIIAKVEDNEIQEQVRQAEASFKVGQATIRQREADLKLAQTNLDRSRSLVDRQLLPQQAFDDVEARHQSAVAQLDLARAQFEQAKARLEELRITLGNTSIPSPVDGFVGKRFVDAGAFVGPNAPVASVVDIRTVRMVANLVEKDVKRVPAGTNAAVEVDAFPGEQFSGRVSRVAPVFDPATRTAEMEIEVPNAAFRLKPGMYARVHLTLDSRENALTVPRNAVIDVEGRSGVFIAAPAPAGTAGGGQAQQGPSVMTARFVPVQTGIRDGEHIEVKSGIQDGARVITTGAGALKDGDRIVAAGTRVNVASARIPAASRRKGAIDERSSSGDSAPRHDVHAFGRDHPARIHRAHAAAGRPDAGRLLPEHHGTRGVSRRGAARDRRARLEAPGAGSQRGRGTRADRVDVAGRLQPRDLELCLGHRPERGGRRRPQPARSRARAVP